MSMGVMMIIWGEAADSSQLLLLFLKILRVLYHYVEPNSENHLFCSLFTYKITYFELI